MQKGLAHGNLCNYLNILCNINNYDIICIYIYSVIYFFSKIKVYKEHILN